MKNYSKPMIYQERTIHCEAIYAMDSSSLGDDSIMTPGPAPTPTRKSCPKWFNKYEYNAVSCAGCSNKVSVPGWLTFNDYCGA